MSNTRGGRRPGAGRPRGSTRSRARMLTHSIKTKEWHQIIDHVKDIANSSGPGSLRAASLLMRDEFGDGLESVERIQAKAKFEAELRARLQAHDERHAAPAQPKRSADQTFEDRVLETLSEPGVKKIFWNSRGGRLCISRAEPDSAPGENQTHSEHESPDDSDELDHNNQKQSN